MARTCGIWRVLVRSRRCQRATLSGRCPVAEFIDALDNKMKAKVFGRVELLEKYGSQLNMPYSRHLDDGIFELRCV